MMKFWMLIIATMLFTTTIRAEENLAFRALDAIERRGEEVEFEGQAAKQLVLKNNGEATLFVTMKDGEETVLVIAETHMVLVDWGGDGTAERVIMPERKFDAEELSFIVRLALLKMERLNERASDAAILARSNFRAVDMREGREIVFKRGRVFLSELEGYALNSQALEMEARYRSVSGWLDYHERAVAALERSRR